MARKGAASESALFDFGKQGRIRESASETTLMAYGVERKSVGPFVLACGRESYTTSRGELLMHKSSDCFVPTTDASPSLSPSSESRTSPHPSASLCSLFPVGQVAVEAAGDASSQWLDWAVSEPSIAKRARRSGEQRSRQNATMAPPVRTRWANSFRGGIGYSNWPWKSKSYAINRKCHEA